MANETMKSMGNAESVSTMLADNSVFVEIDGALRRIKLSDLADAIQTGGLSLPQLAWGVPIKQNQDDNEWGVVGNTAMWEQYKAGIGRYLVTDDGSKMAKMSRNDSTVFADGTAVDETKGNVMFVGKDLYYLVRTDETTQTATLWMSALPIGGHVIKAPIMGAYKGSIGADGKLHSRRGFKPAGSRSIRQFWELARKNGDDYGLTGYQHFFQYLTMLQLSEYGCPDCQRKIGYGVGGKNSNNSSWNAAKDFLTGETASLGDHCGKIDIEPYTTSYESNGATNTETAVEPSHVSLFGVEDAWNWTFEMLQNIYYGNADNVGQTGKEVFVYEGNRMPTEAELATHPNGNYRQMERMVGSDSEMSISGFISEMVLGEYFDIIAKAVKGSSTTRWADYMFSKAKGSDSTGEKVGQLFLAGGFSYSGSRGGVGCSSSGVLFSHASSTCGVRLAYYGGMPELVNGADL